MSKAPLLFAGVLLVIVALVAVRQQRRLGLLTAEVRKAQTASAELERLRAQLHDPAELDRLRTAESELKLEVARLRAALAETRRLGATTTSPAAPGPTTPEAMSPDTNALPAGMRGMMRGVLEQQFQGQLARMKEKLQLTPSQEEAIRSIHARQIEQAGAVAEKMFSGQLTRDEMKDQRGASGNPEEEIRALLNPDQLERYQEYKQEEAAANARLVANAELLQMQGALGLSQEQQDQVFNALYDHTVNQLTGNAATPPATGPAAGPAEALEGVVEAKVKALSGVLTPEQLATYRELQRKQMDLIKGMLPVAEPARDK